MWTKGAVSIFMFLFFFLMIRRPPRSTLFPYPPLSRSPGGEGCGADPPPQGAAAEFAYDALRDNLTLDFGEGQPGQRQSQSIGKFTSESLDLNDDAGGKSGRGARPEVRLPDPGAAPGRIA